jgi:glycosyltransferase involved in cell wall biosynthesis
VTRALVVFGEDWGRHPSSTQHLMTYIARDRPVVWVDSIGLRRPRLTASDAGRVFAKLAAIGRADPPPAARPEKLTIVSPHAVSWPSSRLARMFNRRALSRQIGRILRARKLEHPILWMSLPTAVAVAGALGEAGIAYYCGDDFEALAGVDHRPVAALERELGARADLIFAASDVLARRFPPEKTVVIPHGVDFDLFATPAPRAADLPAGRPVAGFYGSLSDWIDTQMIAAAAASMPDWDFVLIGPVRSDVGALRKQANIQLLGERPHAALPAYAQHWTVSLLPFRDTPQITACNPLKLREYLAAGPPIATMPFPALGPYRHLVHVAESREAFAATIRVAARDRRAMQRRSSVAEETWQRRAEQVSAALDAI